MASIFFILLSSPMDPRLLKSVSLPVRSHTIWARDSVSDASTKTAKDVAFLLHMRCADAQIDAQSWRASSTIPQGGWGTTGRVVRPRE